MLGVSLRDDNCLAGDTWPSQPWGWSWNNFYFIWTTVSSCVISSVCCYGLLCRWWIVLSVCWFWILDSGCVQGSVLNSEFACSLGNNFVVIWYITSLSLSLQTFSGNTENLTEHSYTGNTRPESLLLLREKRKTREQTRIVLYQEMKTPTGGVVAATRLTPLPM